MSEQPLLFDPSLFKVSEEHHVDAELPGLGSFRFQVTPASYEFCMELRQKIIEFAGKLQEEDPEETVDSFFLRVIAAVLSECLTQNLTEEQVNHLALKSGASQGELIHKLANYYGISDVLPFMRRRTNPLPT